MTGNRNITDFFRPSLRVRPPPADGVVHDNIVVAAPRSTERLWPAPRTTNGGHLSRHLSSSPAAAPHSFSGDNVSQSHADENDPPPSSSLPILSQTPPPPPSSSSFTVESRRIVKNGVQMVRSSDSEDDDSSSDSSLKDISEILGKPKTASNGTSMSSRSGQGTLTRSRRGDDRIVAPPPPKSNSRFSLNTLVNLSKKDSDINTKIAEAKARLDAKPNNHAQTNMTTIDENVLAEVLGDGEDVYRKKRAIEALQRTDAFHQDSVWHFFQNSPEPFRGNPFPGDSLSPKDWQAYLRDPTSRDQMFLSGLVARLVTQQSLPDEVIAWIMDDLCSDKSEEIKYAYIVVLQASKSQAGKLLTPRWFSECFSSLGAIEDGIKVNTTIVPTKQATNARKYPIPVGVRWVLELVRSIQDSITLETRVYALKALLRICLDDSVLNDGFLHMLVQATITELVEGIPEHDVDESLFHVSQSIFEALKDTALQQLLVASLPSHTPILHVFKRRLALAFFLAQPLPLTASLTSPSLTDHVLYHLATAEQFRVCRTTDYSVLAASIQLLDTAVSSGFSDLAFLRAESELSFNAQIDGLATTLQRIESRIIGIGARDMTRAEAKAACEKLMYRLEFAVRTKRKRTRDIFVEEGEEERQNLRKWVKLGAKYDMNSADNDETG